MKIARRDEPTIVFRGGSGKPNVRVLMLSGRVIHQCEWGDRADQQPAP
jgi:hypothetical protein